MQQRLRVSLALAIVLGCGLALLVWFQVGGRPRRERAVVARTAEAAEAGEVRPERPLPLPESARTSRASEPLVPEPEHEPPPVTVDLTGRLRLDGAPLEGILFLRWEDGRSLGSAIVGIDGRFRIDDVPSGDVPNGDVSGKVLLEFRPADPPPEESRRALLFPTLELPPTRDATRELDVDWLTKEIHLRVSNERDGPGNARIEVEGPNCRAELETDELGKLQLGVVGEGRYVFRAFQGSGRVGEASIELSGDDDLDTLVIVTR